MFRYIWLENHNSAVIVQTYFEIENDDILRLLTKEVDVIETIAIVVVGAAICTIVV